MEKKCCSPWLNVIEMIKGGQRDDGECFQLMLGNWLRREKNRGTLRSALDLKVPLFFSILVVSHTFGCIPYLLIRKPQAF